MKKYLKFVFIGIIIALIFVGKNIIDKKAFDYKSMISESLNTYYVSNSVNDLNPIIEFLEKNKNNEVIRSDVQNYSYEIIANWFLYMDDKYTCDKSNLNSCKVQLEEFNALNVKLLNLFDKKCEDGFTIILPSAFNSLKNEVTKKITALNKVVASPSSKNPMDSEEIRLKKCLVAIDCNSCRDGLCKCSYVDEKMNKEEIICFKEPVK